MQRCSNTRVDAVVADIEAQLDPATDVKVAPADCRTDGAADAVNSLWRALLEIIKDNAELRKTLNGDLVSFERTHCPFWD